MIVREYGLSEFYNEEAGLSGWDTSLEQRAKTLINNIAHIRDIGLSISPKILLPATIDQSILQRDIYSSAGKLYHPDYRGKVYQFEMDRGMTFGQGYGITMQQFQNMINQKNIDVPTLVVDENAFNLNDPTSTASKQIQSLQKEASDFDTWFFSIYQIKTNADGSKYVTRITDNAISQAQTPSTAIPVTAPAVTTSAPASSSSGSSSSATDTASITSGVITTTPEQVQVETNDIIANAKSQMIKNPLLLVGIGLALVKIGLMIFKPQHKTAKAR